jgi:hypothetical protein
MKKLIERYPGKDAMYTDSKVNDKNFHHAYRWDALHLPKYGWIDKYLLGRKKPEFEPVSADYDGPVYEGFSHYDLGEDALGLPLLHYNADKTELVDELPKLNPGNLIVYRCHTYNEYTGGRNGRPCKGVILEIVRNPHGIKIMDKKVYAVVETSYVIQSVTKSGKLGKKFEWHDRPRFREWVEICDTSQDHEEFYIAGPKYKSRKLYNKLWKGWGYAELAEMYAAMRYWFWTKYKQEKERG